MTDLEILRQLGPRWDRVLASVPALERLGIVRDSVFAWLMCGDSRMSHDEEIYEMHSHALLLLEGLSDCTRVKP